MAVPEEKELTRLANWARFAPEESVARSARRVIIRLITEVVSLKRQLAEIDRFKQIG